jgi:hypothetical protein
MAIAGLFLKNTINLSIRALNPFTITSPKNLNRIAGLNKLLVGYFSRNLVSTPCHNQKYKVENWKMLMVNFDKGTEATNKANEMKYMLEYRGGHFPVKICMRVWVSFDFLEV